jgi:hypothetical protein
VVFKNKIAFVIANGCVAAGDGHIGDANVTFVSTAQLEQLVLRERNNMKTSIGMNLFVSL